MKHAIKYKRWIPAQYPDGMHSRNVNTHGHCALVGTGCFEPEFSQPGILHGFGVQSEEITNGVLNMICAIVEKQDGTIELMSVSCIRIIKRRPLIF